MRARDEGGAPRILGDWEYLLGVQDEMRMGALRLRDASGEYLAADTLAVPPIAELGTVQHLAVDAEHGREAADTSRWLTMLVAPGSSLGGARPKATLRDEQGRLCLAKFPARGDSRDVGAWEWVLNRLAGQGGVAVPESRLLRVDEQGHTFIARRFDRAGLGRRLFASAMTLTGKADMEPASYFDIAAALEQYDPTPELRFHALALDYRSTLPSLQTVRSVAPLYRLNSNQADRIIGEVGTAVATWRAVARSAGIPRLEMEALTSTLGLEAAG